MKDKYITVTQLTKYIKFKIDNDENLNEIFLRGEISNFKAHTRGHYYFTLKDENARINAVMFASSVNKCKFLPQDGMKVLVTGKVSVYEANGGYQIYVNSMIEDGVGNLYIAFEQLKEKLAKEGLFDPAKKKPIPKYPELIGIITAPTGAAIRDMLSTLARRFPLARTILFPSLVQGAEAAGDIVKQIKKASTYPLDLLIVGRGGGSIEDMWCFNDENVARALYDCPIPTISAVGHEIDFTIADFVADLRAPTPTGAMEMGVPNKQDVLILIKQLKMRSEKNMLHQLEVKRERLDQIASRYVLKNPLSMYEAKEEKFDRLLDQLQFSISGLLERNRKRLEQSSKHYFFLHPEKIYDEKQRQLENVVLALKKQVTISMQNYVNPYNQLLSKLDALNPLLTMKRGYAIVRCNDKVISSSKKLKENDLLKITFNDGIITSKVVK